MRLLDLFCCEGGAAQGYADAGFEVVGVDIEPQPRYPFEFHQGDALKWALEHHDEFDAFHASPPCQAWSNAQKIQGNAHEDFIAATRSLFELIGKPWVIENLPYAPRLNCLCDDWECCGSSGGTWTVTCAHCGQTWPCEDYIATHSDGEVRRAKRYTNAREYPPWPEVEDERYDWQDRFERWAFPSRATI